MAGKLISVSFDHSIGSDWTVRKGFGGTREQLSEN